MNGDETIIATVSAHFDSFPGGMFNAGCMEAKFGVRGVMAGSEGANGWSKPADLGKVRGTNS